MISYRRESASELDGGGPSANRPSSGVRFALERRDPPEGEAPVFAHAYEGFAHTPERDVPVALHVDAAGAVKPAPVGDAHAEADAEAAELARDAAALVRATVKAAKTAGRTPPRRIVRWRG